MFDPDDFSYDSYPDDRPSRSYDDRHRAADEVTHLVFVHGRLADSWTEPARGSAYSCMALDIENERRPPRPVLPEPQEPRHVTVLAWLDEAVGGRRALLALDSAPLTDLGTGVPEVDRAADQQRLHATAELLDGVAAELFRHPECGIAVRRALTAVWESDPSVVSRATSAAQLAGGIVWAVGKANAWLGPGGLCTQKSVQQYLGLTSLSAAGQTCRGALQPMLCLGSSRPWSAPAIEPLGRPDLLTSGTRRRLARLRDLALESERIAREASVLPATVDS
jgi:hypothetical protein